MDKNIIHVHIFEPHKGSIFGKTSKNEKSQLHIYSCEKHLECDAFSKGQCINAHNVFGAKCPNGRKSVIEGYSQRAKAYYKQIETWKDQYQEVLWKLKQAPSRVAKVAGGWMLPYPHINMDSSVPFHGKGGFMMNGAPFLADADFTKENFVKIINQRPQAVFGGEIKDYQNKSVPKFVKDLHDSYPDKFKEVANEQAIAIIDSYDNTGRKAKLKTIKPNCEVKIQKEIWFWDGVKISRRDKKIMIFEPISWVECYVEFKPDDAASVVITDNEQVTDSTVFLD